MGTSADPRLRRTGNFNGFSGFGNLDRGWDQALSGTDVLMTFGDDEDPATPQGRGRRWTIWGQGDLQTFRGTPSAMRDYQGDLRTGYLGFDTQVGARLAARRRGGTQRRGGRVAGRDGHGAAGDDADAGAPVRALGAWRYGGLGRGRLRQGDGDSRPGHERPA